MRPLNRDSAPHLVTCFLIQTRVIICGFVAALLKQWWGIVVGSGTKFYGMPLFRRLPGTSIKIGRNCRFNSAHWSNPIGINRRCMLSTVGEGAILIIGDGCGLSGAVITAAEKIVLGNRVMLGANTTITDTDFHPVDALSRNQGAEGLHRPVYIGDDVWLGLNVVVLKGVSIGRGTVVAANSVVLSTLPENVLAAGSPARVIRSLDDVVGPS